MFALELNRDRKTAPPLVDQVVSALSVAIGQHLLREGDRLPSVRQFAASQGLSTFTVAEAYNRLVSMGVVSARRGSGFRVAEREQKDAPAAPAWSAPTLNASWLLSDVFADQSVPFKPGSGWLPTEWTNESGLRHALRALSRAPASRMGGYGHPYGFAPLRDYIAADLRRYSLSVDAGNVLLTHGATQALDLIVRTLLRPGDTVVVESPGYCNLLQILKLAGLNTVGVRRLPDGVDTAELEAVILEHKPKAIFVNTVLQNPTGTTMSMAAAFRLLQVAEKHGLWVVEDDVSRDLAQAGAPCLAAMEGMRRVVYVSGFSKSITPSSRVGYICAQRELLVELARAKMAVGLTSSSIGERLVHKVIIEGHHARHVEHVRDKLAGAHVRVARRMRDAGLEVFHQPNAGLFLWARLPIAAEDAASVTTQALRAGIWLAPGSYFHPREEASNWFRFNAAASDDDALWDFIGSLGKAG